MALPLKVEFEGFPYDLEGKFESLDGGVANEFAFRLSRRFSETGCAFTYVGLALGESFFPHGRQYSGFRLARIGVSGLADSVNGDSNSTTSFGIPEILVNGPWQEPATVTLNLRASHPDSTSPRERPTDGIWSLLGEPSGIIPPPMNSMTGYGRGEASQEGTKVTVEISSVNRKQADIVLHLPRELEALEPRIRDEVNRNLARGRLNIRVSLASSDDASARHLHVNHALAMAYSREFKQITKELGLDGKVTLDTVLRAPGVLQPAQEATDPESLWPAVDRALKHALKALLKMRHREGVHLGRDLRSRVASLRKHATKVQRRAPNVAQRYRSQLLDRVRSLGLENVKETDERLMKEVALFAERSDISEELTRLRSHFKQFDDCVRSAEPVGRMLDFLAQEMNREVNTVGSKANDSDISREVVAMKAELEKFREQVQNIE